MVNQISCLIIDDEPLSCEVLKDYVEASPELVLAGICYNALQAGTALRREEIGLLLLDINMPRLSGIDFIRSLPNPPMVIFVSAYPEFALDGFEVDAVDYLLKPVSFERFRKAINRVATRLGNSKNPNAAETGHIFVKADKKNYRIDFSEISYLEAMGDYVRFSLADKKLTVHGKLKDIISQLPPHLFKQVHKSYVVNLSKIEYIEGNLARLGNDKIPVSLTYRDELFKELNQ
jgi:DNA-binding LytR/AlgR family response regulator